jgi:hypothetical protein
MAEMRERRRRYPKRPAVYLSLLVVGGAAALAAAWLAAQAPGKSGSLPSGKARDAATAAP